MLVLLLAELLKKKKHWGISEKILEAILGNNSDIITGVITKSILVRISAGMPQGVLTEAIFRRVFVRIKDFCKKRNMEKLLKKFFVKLLKKSLK